MTERAKEQRYVLVPVVATEEIADAIANEVETEGYYTAWMAAIAATPIAADDPAVVERVARIIDPTWFTDVSPDGWHPLDNYPKQHEIYRLEARAKAADILRLFTPERT